MVKPDGLPLANIEAAAHRRWLITIIITVVFGGFGAVMAYLSYANSNKPAATSPGRSRPSRPSGTAPGPAPSTAPATPPAGAAPAAEPSSDEGDKARSDKGKPDK